MGKENNLGDFMKDIADTIRGKTGTAGLINPQDFSERIKAMSSGLIPPIELHLGTNNVNSMLAQLLSTFVVEGETVTGIQSYIYEGSTYLNLYTDTHWQTSDCYKLDAANGLYLYSTLNESEE